MKDELFTISYLEEKSLEYWKMNKSNFKTRVLLEFAHHVLESSNF